MNKVLLLTTFLTFTATAAPVTFKVVQGSSLNRLTAESETSVENFTSRTDAISGMLIFDVASKTGSGSITINGMMIKTGIAERDEHMKGPGWFNFNKIPTINFKTSAVKHLNGDQYDVTGSLTLNGVTKPIQSRATVKFTSASAATKAAGAGGDVVALSTSFPIKLNEFNIKNSRIGGQVNNTLNVSLMLIASK